MFFLFFVFFVLLIKHSGSFQLWKLFVDIPKRLITFKCYPSPQFRLNKRKLIATCVINMAELIHLLPAPKVTPANVSGGGGSRSELVITWEVSELEQDSFTHAGKSQTSLFCEDVGSSFINNNRMA